MANHVNASAEERFETMFKVNEREWAKQRRRHFKEKLSCLEREPTKNSYTGNGGAEKQKRKKKKEYRPINLRVLDDVLLIPNGLNTR